MEKTIIAPLVGLFFIILQSFFHVSVNADEQVQIVSGIVTLASVGTVFYGILKNHNKNPQ